VAVGVAMALLGMPNPMLLGVVGFLFNFVPYVGAVISTALVLAVGLVSLPQVGQAGLAAATYFLLTAIEGQFVTPYLIGRHLRLNTVVVFLSVSLWAWLWSVVGMLVATPLLVAIRTLCDHIPSLEPVGDFLSARGDERPEPDEEPAE
jgi:predicted PurR-regulated permease PerM